MTDYGDGPERGNRLTWAFMAAECARLLRERDEARREVKRLRAVTPFGPKGWPAGRGWPDPLNGPGGTDA